ncbi:fringe glycosyltransferase [Adelges cooleyi]|uniref:fringe glycosyltransferase n=1 Tax=Adelges cooleyi TaxID=133065 RepID=UPI00217FF591|nr:fringe glycosyltransferase [Adelges cooleyi]XP_050439556.1 fringe glycosyltransferase [Adelges cooleyi]
MPRNIKRWLTAFQILLALLVLTSLVFYQQVGGLIGGNVTVPSQQQQQQQTFKGLLNELDTSDLEKPSDDTLLLDLDDSVLQNTFITVKTTGRNHLTRLPVIIKTWFQVAKDQTWFFTDTDDRHLSQITNGHVINTNCSATHSRRALCCKMSVELDMFLETKKKWFCHVDDDNYVNVPALNELLKTFDPIGDWYLGRTSTPKPLQIRTKSQKTTFWFATGGAGFCLSRALVLKMAPISGNGKLMAIGDRIGLPDDVSVGYVIEHLLKIPLTRVEQFHSHLEPMRLIKKEMFGEQLTFSYSLDNEPNTVDIEGFSEIYDPTRFISLHCFLFPEFSGCDDQ